MDIKAECWKLSWAVEKSVRYHARRQSFFDRWHKVTAAAGVIFGSTAAVNLLSAGGTTVTLAAALAVTVLSTIDLVVGTPNMARLHNELKRRFQELEGKISCTAAPAETDVNEWRLERLRIEGDEPPVYVALDLLCEVEMARAKGMEPPVRLGTWDTLTSHWLRHENIMNRLEVRTRAATAPAAVAVAVAAKAAAD